MAEVKPTVDLTGTARLDSSFEPAEQVPPEEAVRTGTMRLALATRHSREGLAFTSRLNVLGVTRQAEALRFAQRGSGTFFVRYARRRMDARERLFELSTATRQWAIHAGFDLSLF